MSRKLVANAKVLDYTVNANQTIPLRARAVLVVQDITYTSVAYSAGANSITIEYVDGGTPGGEVVTVVGNAIEVEIDDGVSTATQVLAAINGSAPALALVSGAITGTAGDAQVAAAATPLAGGVTSPLNLTDNTITKTSQPFETGDAVIASSSGSLPTGISGTPTIYYAIYVDANTFKLASSPSNAVQGVAIDISGEGSGTLTLAPGDFSSSISSIEFLDNVSYQIAWTGTLAATLAIQVSNDWDPVKQTGSFYPITVTGLTAPAGTPGGYVVPMNQLPYKWIKLFVDFTSGAGGISCTINAKSVGA